MRRKITFKVEDNFFQNSEENKHSETNLKPCIITVIQINRAIFMHFELLEKNIQIPYFKKNNKL